MNAAPFAYSRAENLGDALRLLQEHGEGAKLIAGGHSLLPVMKLRLAEPETLIDIGRLPELTGTAVGRETLTIRALTTHHQVATDPVIAVHAPLLAATAERIGDRQVRNRGTIGGALAHADSASDYPAAILALDAMIVARGLEGERRIPAHEFFLDFLTTSLKPDEILTEVQIARSTSRLGWSYQKLANQASGYAIVGVAAMVDVDASGHMCYVSIGVTGASAVPWRAKAAEAALFGQASRAAAIAEAALVDSEVEFLDDLHGSAEYRRRVTRGLIQRAVSEAAARAQR